MWMLWKNRGAIPQLDILPGDFGENGFVLNM